MEVNTSTKNQICKTCGAEVRPGSLFCYGCGSSVAPSSQSANGNVSSINEKLPVSGVKPTFENSEIKNKQVAIREEPLKTAAAIRHQEKAPLKKNKEIIWEEPQSLANIWFIIAATILIAFAIGAVLVMLYLR